MSNKPPVSGQYAGMIDRALERYLPGPTGNGVNEAMRYSALNGGKRVRPFLTLEFCRVCGASVERALPFACAVEMVHAYSLIHDDLPCMDDDSVRRGKPSCHKAFGEANALLAGDALLTLAFETVLGAGQISPENRVKAGLALSRAAGHAGMIGGQAVDIRIDQCGADLNTLIETDKLKTGRLIEAAAVLGCLAAGADSKKTDAAGKYASHIGLAFQIVDDLLDSGQEDGGRDEKPTYVTLMGAEKAAEKISELTAKAREALEIFGSEAEILKEFAEKLAQRKS